MNPDHARASVPGLLLDTTAAPPPGTAEAWRSLRLVTCAVRAPQSSRRRHRRRTPRQRTIICAIEGVILLRDPTLPARIEARHNLPPGAVVDLMRWPSTLLATIGALDHRTWLRHAQQSLPPAAIAEILSDHGSVNTPVVDLLRAATTGGLRLVLTANTTTRLYDDLAHHGLADLAAQVYLSVESGYATPDPRALEHILHSESLNPARTLYIDADRRSVEIAEQLGLRTHTYTGEQPLRHFLTHHYDLRQPEPTPQATGR